MKLSLLVFLIFIASCGAQVKSEGVKNNQVLRSDKPNLVFYLSDDRDVLDYGCYGNPTAYTTTVDALAKKGFCLIQAYTGQAICAPNTKFNPVKKCI